MIPLRDTTAARIFPFWVVILIAINAFIFFLEITANNPEMFILQYALIPRDIDFLNLETLTPFITSQFLHGGWLHIITNMWFLWVFGDNVEEKLGFLIFPVFYLITGAIGAFVQYLVISDSHIPMIGASGAIAGVLGAYMAFFPKHRIDTLVLLLGFPVIIQIPAFLMLFYWLTLQLVSSTAAIVSQQPLGGVAYFAHIGGFVFGWFIGRILKA